MTWANILGHVLAQRDQSPCYALPIFILFLLLIFYERLILRPTLTEVRETYIHVVDLDCDYRSFYLVFSGPPSTTG